jgi:hypothetical protein
MSKCPPGVICLSHLSLILSIVLVTYICYLIGGTQHHEHETTHVRDRQPIIITQAGYPGPMADPQLPPLRQKTSAFTQQGILKSKNGDHTILPLMGRCLHRSRDSWLYYTYKDGSNLIKLPILYNNKNCTGEYGCDRLTSSDVVYVEGYDNVFEVSIYDNDCFRYDSM